MEEDNSVEEDNQGPRDPYVRARVAAAKALAEANAQAASSKTYTYLGSKSLRTADDSDTTDSDQTRPTPHSPSFIIVDDGDEIVDDEFEDHDYVYVGSSADKITLNLSAQETPRGHAVARFLTEQMQKRAKESETEITEVTTPVPETTEVTTPVPDTVPDVVSTPVPETTEVTTPVPDTVPDVVSTLVPETTEMTTPVPDSSEVSTPMPEATEVTAEPEISMVSTPLPETTEMTAVPEIIPSTPMPETTEVTAVPEISMVSTPMPETTEVTAVPEISMVSTPMPENYKSLQTTKVTAAPEIIIVSTPIPETTEMTPVPEISMVPTPMPDVLQPQPCFAPRCMAQRRRVGDRQECSVSDSMDTAATPSISRVSSKSTTSLRRTSSTPLSALPKHILILKKKKQLPPPKQPSATVTSGEYEASQRAKQLKLDMFPSKAPATVENLDGTPFEIQSGMALLSDVALRDAASSWAAPSTLHQPQLGPATILTIGGQQQVVVGSMSIILPPVSIVQAQGEGRVVTHATEANLSILLPPVSLVQPQGDGTVTTQATAAAKKAKVSKKANPKTAKKGAEKVAEKVAEEVTEKVWEPQPQAIVYNPLYVPVKHVKDLDPAWVAKKHTEPTVQLPVNKRGATTKPRKRSKAAGVNRAGGKAVGGRRGVRSGVGAFLYAAARAIREKGKDGAGNKSSDGQGVSSEGDVTAGQSSAENDQGVGGMTSLQTSTVNDQGGAGGGGMTAGQTSAENDQGGAGGGGMTAGQTSAENDQGGDMTAVQTSSGGKDTQGGGGLTSLHTNTKNDQEGGGGGGMTAVQASAGARDQKNPVGGGPSVQVQVCVHTGGGGCVAPRDAARGGERAGAGDGASDQQAGAGAERAGAAEGFSVLPDYMSGIEENL